MIQTTAVVAPSAITRPASQPRLAAATAMIAGRALRKYFRTPGLFVMGVVQSAMFLFSFRYVFGGAIQVGAAGYVGYLVPATSPRSSCSPAAGSRSRSPRTRPRG